MLETRPSYWLETYRENPAELFNFIEKIYVSGGSYEFRFTESFLPSVEVVFDKIMFKHGLNSEIDISYKIEG